MLTVPTQVKEMIFLQLLGAIRHSCFERVVEKCSMAQENPFSRCDSTHDQPKAYDLTFLYSLIN
jgi:hypothetical protein